LGKISADCDQCCVAWTVLSTGEYYVNDYFHKFAQSIATTLGKPSAFIVALLLVLAWAVTGPLFHFSDTWQLVINTSTTVITFLMVFLIQNTQNRDARAIHLKLDELIRTTRNARNNLVDLEEMTDQELDELAKEFQRVRDRASTRKMEDKRGEPHTDRRSLGR
jgi:low affinity Fe/Cu permease